MSARAVPPPFDNPEVEHESSDVPVRAILQFLGVAGVAAVVVHLLVWMLLQTLARRGEGPTSKPDVIPWASRPPEGPPAPGFADPGPGFARAPLLQVDPPRDMARLREAQQRRLHGYSWDPETRTGRIPIADAMRLVLEEQGRTGDAAGSSSREPGAPSREPGSPSREPGAGTTSRRRGR